MAMAVDLEEPYKKIYRDYQNVLCGKSTDVLNSQRAKAYALFDKVGFPTIKTEAYRHTNLQEALAVDYGMNINRVNPVVNAKDLFKCQVQGINSYVFFVVNDTFYCPDENLKDLEELRSMGVMVGSLAEYAKNEPEVVAKFYNKQELKKDPFVAFNTVFAQDGFFLYVPKNVKLPRPVQLISVMYAGAPLMANERDLIVLEEGSQAQLLVCTHTVGETQTFANRVTEVYVGENATYDHYKLEGTNAKTVSVGSVYIRQEANSNVLVNDITLQNGVSRNNIVMDLEGEGCESQLCGMAVTDKKEHIDNFTILNHNKPKCKSNEMYKYVLDGESTGVFSGRIYVEPGAQKTEAYQVNRNVCLKPTARMFTQPQLEIYADDVKCSHGASTGVMDDNAMFYLRSRGIPEAEAKMLLMYAFVNDVVENVRIEAVKEKIKQMVEMRFRGELSKCSGCSVCR